MTQVRQARVLGRRRIDDVTWDALVVGAGPAGLFAALSAARGGATTLLIDAGQPVRARRRGRSGADAATADYESGIGGAGLFSDGKLCLSLDVGGQLANALGVAERERVHESVKRTLLDALGNPEQPSLDVDALDELLLRAAEVGLAFKYYPVLHVGTDRCRRLVTSLVDLLSAAGVTVVAQATLEGLEIDADTGSKVASIRRRGRQLSVRARTVVLALGKVGAAREAELFESLGVPVTTQPLYIGLRYEGPAEALAPLYRLTKDPKYSLTFADGTKIKTHCASEGGEVISLTYDGLPLAGGHNYSDVRSRRSGFSILWNGGYANEPDPYAAALGLMRQSARATNGRLRVQRVLDYLGGQASTGRSVRNVPLTCRDSAAGDVRAILPAAYFARLDEFLTRLARLAPGIFDEEAVFFAPAIEWWMRRITVDKHMQTPIDGLYACGDGSGWSQGIVHAAATGWLAGSHIGSRPRASRREQRSLRSASAPDGALRS